MSKTRISPDKRTWISKAAQCGFADLELVPIPIHKTCETGMSVQGWFKARSGLPIIEIAFNPATTKVEIQEVVLHEIMHYWQWIEYCALRLDDFWTDDIMETQAYAYARDARL